MLSDTALQHLAASAPAIAPASASAPGSAIADTGPDADLIALSRVLLRSATRLHRCDAGLAGIADRDYERAQHELHEGARVLMQLHPVTMEGLAAKTQFVRVQFERLVACDYATGPDRCGETHERLAWSILNDILEMTGTLADTPTFRRGIAIC